MALTIPQAERVKKRFVASDLHWRGFLVASVWAGLLLAAAATFAAEDRNPFAGDAKAAKAGAGTGGCTHARPV